MKPAGRLWVVLTCAVALLGLSNAAAFAQDKYPSRPIRIIVPLPPGGAIDVFVRAFSRDYEALSLIHI